MTMPQVAIAPYTPDQLFNALHDMMTEAAHGRHIDAMEFAEYWSNREPNRNEPEPDPANCRGSD